MTMGPEERLAMWIKRLIYDFIKRHYDEGDLLAVLHSDQLYGRMRSIAHEYIQQVTCHEIGSAAELRRLKEYLGDTLPADWEQQHFNKIIGR
jgi:hypothetical protein